MTNSMLRQAVEKAKQCQGETLIEALAELDTQGLLLGDNEDQDTFFNRADELVKSLDEIDQKVESPTGFEIEKNMTLYANNRIEKSLIIASQERLKTTYGVELDWVPCFYPERDLGLLWAGCTLGFEELPYPIILLKRAFAKNEKYLKIYTRSELITHELAHAARMGLHSIRFEELLAYKLSTSTLRRAIGNCFQTLTDALLFFVPMLALCAIQFLTVIFKIEIPHFYWLIAMGLTCCAPAYLLLRNEYEKHLFSKAILNLKKIKIQAPQAVLFRCTDQEIIQLAKTENMEAFLKERESNLRWKVIIKRWIQRSKIGDQT